MRNVDFTFGIQRSEQETDFDDYVTYHVYLVSPLSGGHYTLTAISSDHLMTEAHAVIVANQFADLFRSKGSSAEVIHLPTVRRRNPF
jgi:hypothetical protein